MEKINPNKSLGSKDSFYGFRKAFIKNEKMPLEARFLLVLLMTYKGKNESCWPSQIELAKRMGRATDTVRKYLRLLQRNGNLKVKSRGMGRSLLYTPSYLNVYAGYKTKNDFIQKPDEMARQRPDETSRHRSISSGNKKTEEINKDKVKKVSKTDAYQRLKAKAEELRRISNG